MHIFQLCLGIWYGISTLMFIYLVFDQVTGQKSLPIPDSIKKRICFWHLMMWVSFIAFFCSKFL